MIFEEEQKNQPITRLQVWNAFKKIKANGGSQGIDGMTIEEVAKHPRKYLYPLWNRLASGSYFPKSVRQVLIPKQDGTMRPLGIPTVLDRTAQQVIKDELEDLVDVHFSPNSFGYRPNRGAHEAIEQCRQNCLKYSWAIDLDIKGFFDNIDHDLLMSAVLKFTDRKHILLYTKRWLKVDVQQTDGTLKKNDGKGTPQGGVISPLLANIFLHFVFDKWMELHYPENKFERYADDIIIHCKNITEALRLLDAVKQRMTECKLEINQQKSKIVYCRRNQKRQPPFKTPHQEFDFLGYTFKPRVVFDRGKIKIGFTPSMSTKSQMRIGLELYKLKIHRMVHVSLDRIASLLRSKTIGWLNYFGKFRLSGMQKVFKMLNMRLARMVRSKYRRFRNRHWYESYKWLKQISHDYPTLFVHWKYGFLP